MSLDTPSKKRRGGWNFRLPPGRLNGEGGQKNEFPSIKKNPEVIGQNKPDFRNQREKLPQKHVFIVRVHF